MHFVNVLYYHYFLFYTKVLPDDEPHATVVFTLSFCESWLVFTLIDWIGAIFFCRLFINSKWIMATVLLLLIGINYVFYIRNGNGRRIVKQQPVLWQSKKFSIAVAFLFCFITISFLFWTNQYFQNIISNCKL